MLMASADVAAAAVMQCQPHSEQHWLGPHLCLCWDVVPAKDTFFSDSKLCGISVLSGEWNACNHAYRVNCVSPFPKDLQAILITILLTIEIKI